MGQGQSKLIQESPKGFFFARLHDAARHQNIKLPPLLLLYLVDLLARYIQGGRDLEAQNGPLALLYLEALNLKDERQRRALLRELGDFSLFASGFFAESFPRRLMDKSYYMLLGGKAYALLSLRLPAGQGEQAQLFHDLSRRFAAWVELLGEVSERSGNHDDRRLLALYENYLRTGNPRLRRQLVEWGLLTDPESEPASSA